MSPNYLTCEKYVFSCRKQLIENKIPIPKDEGEWLSHFFSIYVKNKQKKLKPLETISDPYLGKFLHSFSLEPAPSSFSLIPRGIFLNENFTFLKILSELH